MPIKLSTTVGGTASQTITAEELEDGMEHFSAHYFCNNTTGEYEGKDYSVPWAMFSACITEYMSQYPEVGEENIAVRFVHSFDISTNTLYMRMQLCQMQLTTMTEYNSQVYELLDNSNVLWYEVKQNQINSTTDHSLMDESYLNSFSYKPVATGAVSQVLASDGGLKYVRTLTFPWATEIKQMYIDNGGDTLVEPALCFSSCSYTAAEPGMTAVLWPHGLVMYLFVGGSAMLDDEDYVSIFHYKGADMGTACPPKCNSYITPQPIMADIQKVK